jgi:hypothetical protein
LFPSEKALGKAFHPGQDMLKLLDQFLVPVFSRFLKLLLEVLKQLPRLLWSLKENDWIVLASAPFLGAPSNSYVVYVFSQHM